MKLQDIEKKIYSQNGEDGIVKYLLSTFGHDKNFIELGSGNGKMNNTRLLSERGYRGIVVDRKTGNIGNYIALAFERELPVVPVLQHINLKTISDIVEIVPFKKEITFLSLDIDSIDYWIMKQLLDWGIKPKLCCVEYNATFGKRPLTVKYSDYYQYKVHKHYDFGCGLEAWKRLFSQHRYKFITAESNGVNAFFMRENIAVELEGAHEWIDNKGFEYHDGHHSKRFRKMKHIDFHEVLEK